MISASTLALLRAALPRAAAALAIAVTASGCIIVRDHDHDGWDDGHRYDPDDGVVADDQEQPTAVEIDVGETVGSIEPGVGAGVFVETDEAGHWRIFTACDTEISGYLCGFELSVQADGVSVDVASDLEPEDAVDEYEGQVDLYFETGYDFDEVTLHALAGAPLTLTMYLDGVSQPELIYWVGGGYQNEGAPGNPVTFYP